MDWQTVWLVLANIAGLLTVIAFIVTAIAITRALVERPQLDVSDVWDTPLSGRVVIRNSGLRPARNFSMMVMSIHKSPIRVDGETIYDTGGLLAGSAWAVYGVPLPKRHKGPRIEVHQDRRVVVVYLEEDSSFEVHATYSSAWIPGGITRVANAYSQAHRLGIALTKDWLGDA